jgi:dihydrolipoamide dehydrogenase
MKIVFCALALAAFTEALVPVRTSLRGPVSLKSVVALNDAANGGVYDFDVAIIGCGVGGHGAALHARAQKLKTAVFAGQDVGGTCVNRGCVPSKALLAASGRVREMRNDKHLSEMGITVQGTVEFDRTGIAAHAQSLADKVKSNLGASLVGLGVEVIEGRGVLTGKPHEIKDQLTGKIYTAKVRAPWLTC